MAVIFLKNIGFSIFGLIIALIVLPLAPINSAKDVDQSAIGPNHLIVMESDSGQLHLIDLENLHLIRSFSTDIFNGAAQAANGHVYFVGKHSLLALDLSNGELKTLNKAEELLITKAPRRPGSLVVSPSSKLAVTAHHAIIGVDRSFNESGTFWLSVFNLETGDLIAKIPPAPDSIKRSLDAACFNSSMMISPDGQQLYQVCGGWTNDYNADFNRMLRVVALPEGRIIGRLKLPERGVSELSPDGKRLYILTQAGQISTIDPQKLAVIETKSLRDGDQPITFESDVQMLIGPNSDRLFIRAGKDPAYLYSINTSSWKVTSRANLRESPEDVVISHDGRRLFLLMYKRLAVLNPEDLREVGSVELPGRSPYEERRFLLPIQQP